MKTERRLDQWLANLGYCSRREANVWIRKGRVTVNGVPARSAGLKAAAEAILVDGEPLDHPDGIFLRMHKPLGLVCSHESNEGPTVYSLLPQRWLARNPQPSTIGRLDKETSGLIFITDDGQLLHRWTSPKHDLAKTYEVTVDKPLHSGLIEVFASGSLVLDGEDKPCKPAQLSLIDDLHATLVLTEGKYHQVRRMFSMEGYTVTRLHRSRIGGFELDHLQPSEWELLAPDLKSAS